MLGPSLMLAVKEDAVRIFICGILPSLQGQLLLIHHGPLTTTSSRKPSLLFLRLPSTFLPLAVGRLDLREIRLQKNGSS